MSFSSFPTDYCQTDAETEFMEDTCIKGDTCPIPEQAIDNEECVRPNEGEPVSDKEWIAQYKAKRNSAEEHLQIHRNSLEGLETLGSWYV